MAPIDAQDSDLREMIGRFRVLIIGRRNAGKTTILQKVCDTTDNPEIYDTEGRKIHVVLKSSIERGNHDIKNAMVFKSNPGFVFHDSRGFEAGSEAEFEETKKFISEGVNAKKLKERIHAIWYCIPMDDRNRTFQSSEEKFFLECDTRRVPVVVVFTKFAELHSVAYGEIKEQLEGLSEEECSRRIAQRVEELFANTGVLNRLNDPKNRTRPKSHVRLEDMTEPNANCNNLLKNTTFALDDEELRLCLVSTQQSNLELCIKCAVGTLVDNANRSLASFRIAPEDYQYDIARWFPHLKLEESRSSYSFSFSNGYYEGYYESGHQVPDFNNNLFNPDRTWKHDIIPVLQPLALVTPVNRIIQIGIATIIVLEYSAFLPKTLENLEPVESAVDYYLKSPTAVAVEAGAKEISRQGYKKEELEKKILEFILENRMSAYSKRIDSKEVDDA